MSHGACPWCAANSYPHGTTHAGVGPGGKHPGACFMHETVRTHARVVTVRRTSQNVSFAMPLLLIMLLRMRTCRSPLGLLWRSASARPHAVTESRMRRATAASRSPCCSACCCGGSGAGGPLCRSADVRRSGQACCTPRHRVTTARHEPHRCRRGRPGRQLCAYTTCVRLQPTHGAHQRTDSGGITARPESADVTQRGGARAGCRRAASAPHGIAPASCWQACAADSP